MSVINLSDRRQPVAYTVRITHHWDDSIEVLVEDVADDERSRQSVADALARAANTFVNRTAPMPEEIDQLTRERDEAWAEVERQRAEIELLREELQIAANSARVLAAVPTTEEIHCLQAANKGLRAEVERQRALLALRVPEVKP